MRPNSSDDTELFTQLMLALVYYDYMLTFSSEVRCIWMRKITAPSVLFLINRYLSLIFFAIIFIQLVPFATADDDKTNEVCLRYLS